MTLSDIASIGSLVSGVAVLISLVYLGLRTTMTGPGHRAAWKVVRDAFDRAFQDYMDGVIAETAAAAPNAALERWRGATATAPPAAAI